MLKRINWWLVALVVGITIVVIVQSYRHFGPRHDGVAQNNNQEKKAPPPIAQEKKADGKEPQIGKKLPLKDQWTIANEKMQEGALEEALEIFRYFAKDLDESVRFQAVANIRWIWKKQGKWQEVISICRSHEFNWALAWELATCPIDTLRDGKEALRLAEKEVAADPDHPYSIDILAAACAETGDFARAVKTEEEALRKLIYVAGPQGNFQGHEKEFKERLALYKTGKPYRQTKK